MAMQAPTILTAASGIVPVGGSVSLTFALFPPTLSSATWYASKDGVTSAGRTVTEGSGTGWGLQQVTVMGGITGWQLTLDAELVYDAAGSEGTIGILLSANDGTSGESATVSAGAVTVYHQPELAMRYPEDGGQVTLLPLYVIWDVVDATDSVGVASQVVTIRHGSEVIAQARPDVAVRQVSWHASELPLVNGETYSATVVVTDGMGLPISVSATFATAWEAPPAPTIAATASGAAATIDVASVRDDVTTNVWRVIDGERHLLGSVGGTSGTVTDPLPPLGVEVTYEAQSVYDETGATSAITTSTATIGGRSWAINASTDPADLLQLYGNPSASRSLDQGGDSYHFADGGAGGGLPVWYGLTDRDESGSLSFDTVGPETTRQLWRLLDEHPVVWLRDPFGNRWRAHVQPSVSHGVGKTWAIELKWDAMRFEEA